MVMTSVVVTNRVGFSGRTMFLVWKPATHDRGAQETATTAIPVTAIPLTAGATPLRLHAGESRDHCRHCNNAFVAIVCQNHLCRFCLGSFCHACSNVDAVLLPQVRIQELPLSEWQLVAKNMGSQAKMPSHAVSLISHLRRTKNGALDADDMDEVCTTTPRESKEAPMEIADDSPPAIFPIPSFETVEALPPIASMRMCVDCHAMFLSAKGSSPSLAKRWNLFFQPVPVRRGSDRVSELLASNWTSKQVNHVTAAATGVFNAVLTTPAVLRSGLWSLAAMGSAQMAPAASTRQVGGHHCANDNATGNVGPSRPSHPPPCVAPGKRREDAEVVDATTANRWSTGQPGGTEPAKVGQHGINDERIREAQGSSLMEERAEDEDGDRPGHFADLSNSSDSRGLSRRVVVPGDRGTPTRPAAAATHADKVTGHDAAIVLLDDDRQQSGHIEPPVTAYMKTSLAAAATDSNIGHTPPPRSSSWFDEANERFVEKMASTRVEPVPTAANVEGVAPTSAVGALSGEASIVGYLPSATDDGDLLDAREESTTRNPFTPEGCDLVGTRLRPREQPGNTIADAGGSSIPTTCCHPGCKSTDSSFLSNFFGKSKTLKQCAKCHQCVCGKHSTTKNSRTACKSCPVLPPSVAK